MVMPIAKFDGFQNVTLHTSSKPSNYVTDVYPLIDGALICKIQWQPGKVLKFSDSMGTFGKVQ